MRKIINIIFIFSIIVIILSIIIAVFPSFFKNLNEYLSNLTNLLTYLGMLFASIALFIASLAYKSSIIRPDLTLNIYTYMAEQDGPVLAINKKTNLVSMCRPLTEWYITLVNTGDASARFPLVQIVFDGAFFIEDDFPGWKAIYHAHALGWFGFQWAPEENAIIYPDLPVQLPIMYFNDKGIDNIPLDISVTIVADGFKKKRTIFQ